MKKNYFEKLFLIDTYLIFQKQSFSLCFLIDSDSIIYMIIHFNLVNKVCKKLRIQFISLTKEKLIKDYEKVWMILRRCVMMKCCALIACKVFAIAQTLIISMCMLQAICMQIRKSNRTQNYERNRLWKSFNSVSCHCNNENWDRTLLHLIC